MTKTILLSLIVALVCTLAFPINAEETLSRPSLKQLIDDPANRTFPPGGYPAPWFDAYKVRRNFFGDEVAFRREVVSLLQTEEDDSAALVLISFFDINDETILTVLREKFVLSDIWSQGYICNILARNPSEKNINFLVEVLKQPNISAHLRSITADSFSRIYSSETDRLYFESMETERKKDILGAFFSCLDDEREIRYQYGRTGTVGDKVAVCLGRFGSSGKPALPIIKKKFATIQDGIEYGIVVNKLELAWAIVNIAPDQCNVELEYILKKATKDKSANIRWEAINNLDQLPLSLSEKVIPVLCTIIQKETSISNKRLAAESLHKILEKQWLANDDEEAEDNETEVGKFSSRKNVVKIRKLSGLRISQLRISR